MGGAGIRAFRPRLFRIGPGASAGFRQRQRSGYCGVRKRCRTGRANACASSTLVGCPWSRAVAYGLLPQAVPVWFITKWRRSLALGYAVELSTGDLESSAQFGTPAASGIASDIGAATGFSSGGGVQLHGRASGRYAGHISPNFAAPGRSRCAVRAMGGGVGPADWMQCGRAQGTAAPVRPGRTVAWAMDHSYLA